VNTAKSIITGFFLFAMLIVITILGIGELISTVIRG
jgi:hypothetical protein